MMHNWSGLDLEQLVYSSDKLKKDPNHWGVSDVNGILGGFPIDKIKTILMEILINIKYVHIQIQAMRL